MIDRLRFGYVVDFVQWYWKSFHWPVFNLADSCIVVGAVLMVLFSLRHGDKGKIALMDIVLANPRGFCAGVDRAIEIVKRAIETLGAPIYVRHEVVHNRFVVEDLRQRGAVFVEELDEVPAGGTVIFSAHGVSQAVRNEAGRSRPEDIRRDLPAGHQGAYRSGAALPRRPRRDPDRP